MGSSSKSTLNRGIVLGTMWGAGLLLAGAAFLAVTRAEALILDVMRITGCL